MMVSATTLVLLYIEAKRAGSHPDHPIRMMYGVFVLEDDVEPMNQ